MFAHMPEIWGLASGGLTNREASSLRLVCRASATGCEKIEVSRWDERRETLRVATGHGAISPMLTASVDCAFLELVGDAPHAGADPGPAAMWGALHWSSNGTTVDWVDAVVQYALDGDFMWWVYGIDVGNVSDSISCMVSRNAPDAARWSAHAKHCGILPWYYEISNHGLADVLDRDVPSEPAMYPLWDSNPRPPD